MAGTWKAARTGVPPKVETLRITAEAPRDPGPGEVLVRVQACSLNFHDYVVVTGVRNEVPEVIPMSDGAGVVEAVGPGVRDFAVGDLVMSLFFPRWRDGEPTPYKVGDMPGDTHDGFAAEYVVAPVEALTRAPSGYTAEEAATLPCAALTAWRALFVEAKIKPGDWVVTQGSGGVSLFALQFAKACGAQVVATSSSDAKLKRLAELGADELINYKTTPAWGAEVVARTRGAGADVVVEIGGAGTLGQSIDAVRMGGHISLIGVLAGWHGDVPTMTLFAKNACLKGITVGSREHQLDMVRAIEANGLRPVIDRRFALDDIAEAFRAMEAQTHFGKIVLTI